MRSLLFAAGTIAALALGPALAQAPMSQGGMAPSAAPAPAMAPPAAAAPQGMPANVRGRVVKLDGQTLTVKTREGPTVTVALAPDAAVRAFARKKLGDIKDGDYIASSSMMGKDGKLHAIEIHYLAPTTPEGQRPWDLRKDSVMTNAHVNGIAKMSGGTDLTVTFKGGSAEIVVGPKTIIVGPADATSADLKPGKTVFLFAVKAPDGGLRSRAVFVEKNGVRPPL